MAEVFEVAKVRTVTYGITIRTENAAESIRGKVREAVHFLQRAQRRLSAAGFAVQTLRLATNPFEEYCGDSDVRLDTADRRFQLLSATMEDTVARLRADEDTSEEAMAPVLLCVGPATTLGGAHILRELLPRHPSITASLVIPNATELPSWQTVPDARAILAMPDGQMAEAAAEIIMTLSRETPGGEGNFNFAASFNCPPMIPFFPAAYHSGDVPGPSFALGLELADLFVQAAEAHVRGCTRPVWAHSEELMRVFTGIRADVAAAAGRAQTVAEAIARETEVAFVGVDTSLAPYPKARSLVEIFEMLGTPVFGGSGSVLVASLITRTLQSLPGIHKCGYSGLLLPPLEDQGLADRAKAHAYTLRDILLASAVCGTGLDTVPVPGDSTVDQLTALLLDVGSLAFRWDKPLSCRLFPVPHKRAGDVTTFTNPHLCNGVVFSVP